MKDIIFAFALRFYGLLMVAVILSLLSGLGTLAIFSGIFAAIGSIIWVLPTIKTQIAGLKN
ncbi:hypothetical protein [Shewanella sp.]|uniref:hypothetical protein n=1 Tax=Shewanella sp. TaxID=50422 RepID=UPI00356B20AE